MEDGGAMAGAGIVRLSNAGEEPVVYELLLLGVFALTQTGTYIIM